MFTIKSFHQTNRAILLLRIITALLFFLHAFVRVIKYTIPNFTEFLAEKGFVYPELMVWVITVFELAGSLLLAMGFFKRLLSAAFILLMIMGIILIHAELGWFVGEHGTGGSEYSVLLIAALLVIAADDKKK